MSALILRHNWTRQPQATVEIDWSHAWAEHLAAFLLPVGGTLVDLVSRAIAVRGATAGLGTLAQGRAIGSNGSNGIGWTIDTRRVYFPKASLGVTMLAGNVCNTVSNARKPFFRACTSTGVGIMILEHGTGLSPDVRVVTTTNEVKYPIAQLFTPAASEYYSFGFSKRVGDPSGWAFSSDGVQLDGALFNSDNTSSGTTWYDDLSVFQVCGASSLGFPGLLTYAALFRDALPQSALNSLTANPWQLLRPMARRMWVVPAAAEGTDALTASNLTISAPVLGTPALGQAHALTASVLTVEGPVLGAPTLAQIHALVASGLTTSSPELGAPALGQIHSLTASDLTVSAPVLGTPTLSENAEDVDALTADDLVVGSPVLGTPTLGQIHVLNANGLTTGAPVLGTPSLEVGKDHLIAQNLVTEGPVLGTSVLRQIHKLVASFSPSAPVLGVSSFKQVHVLVSAGLVGASPVLGTPVFVELPPIEASEVERIVFSGTNVSTYKTFSDTNVNNYVTYSEGP